MGAPRAVNVFKVVDNIDFLSDSLADLSVDPRISRDKGLELQGLARDWNRQMDTFKRSMDENQIPELYRLALRIQTEYRAMGLTVKLDETHPPQLLERIFDLNMVKLDRYMLEHYPSQRNELQTEEAPRRGEKIAVIAARNSASSNDEFDRPEADQISERIETNQSSVRVEENDSSLRAEVVTPSVSVSEEKKDVIYRQFMAAMENKIAADARVEAEKQAAVEAKKAARVAHYANNAASEIENIKLLLEKVGPESPKHIRECRHALSKIEALSSNYSHDNARKIFKIAQEIRPKLQGLMLEMNDPEAIQRLEKRGVPVSSSIDGVQRVNAEDMLASFSSGLDTSLKGNALHEIEIRVKQIGISDSSRVLKQITSVLDDTSMKETEKQAALLKIAQEAQGNFASQTLNRAKDMFFRTARTTEKSELYSFIIDNLQPASAAGTLSPKDPERTHTGPMAPGK